MARSRTPNHSKSPRRSRSPRLVLLYVPSVHLAGIRANDLAAMLGGKLVYEYAVGVQRQGPSKEVKDEQARAAARGEL
jgi:hypothetical protein